jgi:nucleoside-diphosphate-sugar epimerase
LPLGAVHNLRSLVALDNLVDFLQLCGTHPVAAGQCFLISDDADLSTPDLIRQIASALGRATRLVSVPAPILALAEQLLGHQQALSRLTDHLQVDIHKARTLLGWRPVVSVAQGIADAVRGLGSPR